MPWAAPGNRGSQSWRTVRTIDARGPQVCIDRERGGLGGDCPADGGGSCLRDGPCEGIPRAVIFGPRRSRASFHLPIEQGLRVIARA
jgi:hypothetical protein